MLLVHGEPLWCVVKVKYYMTGISKSCVKITAHWVAVDFQSSLPQNFYFAEQFEQGRKNLVQEGRPAQQLNFLGVIARNWNSFLREICLAPSFLSMVRCH